MNKGATRDNLQTSLAERLQGFSAEPFAVQQKRNELLALRGLAEMLVLRGIQARERLASGRYQLSLKSEISGKGALAQTATEELREVVDALGPQLLAFETTLEHFDDLGVATTATRNGVTVIGGELEDHVRRLPQLKRLLEDWSTALN